MWHIKKVHTKSLPRLKRELNLIALLSFQLIIARAYIARKVLHTIARSKSWMIRSTLDDDDDSRKGMSAKNRRK